MKLTKLQTARVAKIIEKHTSWTVGWWIDDEEKAVMYTKCAAAIARYLNRQRRR